MSKRRPKPKPPAPPPPADWRQEAERRGEEAFEASTAPDPEPTAAPAWWEIPER